MYYNIFAYAGVAELADAQDLKSCDLFGRVGSSPTLGTVIISCFSECGATG